VRVETRLNTYAQRVDERLADLLPNDVCAPSELHAAMRYACLAPGKRLRPALCLASAQAVGAEISPAVLDAACAVEMVHCFSLIHDDLPAIDDDDLRRGLPTCHVKFGEALALLAGDALFSLAFEVLSGADAPAAKVLRSVRSLSKATGSDGLVGGEVMDVLAEGKAITVSQLHSIHSRKTGALMAACCEIGGLLGGGSEEQVGVLRDFGAKIGLAFQIVDDLLNETSTAEQLGKAAGSDRERSKATYPALHGVEGTERAARTALNEAIGCLGTGLVDGAVLRELAEFSVERLN
jgi:geranylgeranyl diphosphate synthase type II